MKKKIDPSVRQRAREVYRDMVQVEILLGEMLAETIWNDEVPQGIVQRMYDSLTVLRLHFGDSTAMEPGSLPRVSSKEMMARIQARTAPWPDDDDEVVSARAPAFVSEPIIVGSRIDLKKKRQLPGSASLVRDIPHRLMVGRLRGFGPS